MARKKGLDLDEVLADRVRPRPSADDLVDLIVRVNPTGHDLPEPERSERYRAKSGLQSLLVRYHAELLAVGQSADGIVHLELAASGRHAAHARLEELDDDARSWVQRQLDVGDDEATTQSAHAGARSASSPLGRARKARDEGDFDEAGARYEEAASRATSRHERAIAWAERLAMLVELAWDDEAVLALGARLSNEPDVLAQPRVRSPLALAAARSGDLARARAWLTTGGPGHTPSDGLAVEAWAQLGMTAASHADRALLTDAVHALRAIEPTIPALSELERALALLQASSIRDDDARFAETLIGADLDERERLSRERLRRVPESPRARAELDAIAAERRTARHAELIARAASEPDIALRAALLRTARAEGAGGLDDEIHALEVAQRADAQVRAQRELAQAVRGAPAEALEAWLAAPHELRAHVPLDAELAELAARVTQASPARGSLRDTVRAVLAHREIERALERGDGALAARQLQEIGRALDVLAEAGVLRQRVREAEQQRLADEHAAVERGFAAALAAGEHEGALAEARKLPGARAEALVAIAERARARRAAIERLEASRALGDIDAALAECRALRSTATDDRERWDALYAELQVELTRAWRFERCTTDREIVMDARTAKCRPSSSILCEDGEHLVLVAAVQRHLFFERVHVPSSRTVALAWARDPRSDALEIVGVLVADGRVVVTLASGDVVRLDDALRGPLDVSRGTVVVPAETRLERCVRSSDAAVAMALLRDHSGQGARAAAIDPASGRLSASRRAFDIEPARGPGATRFATIDEEGVSLLDRTARRLHRIELAQEGKPLLAMVAPDALHVMVESKDEGADEIRIRWLTFDREAIEAGASAVRAASVDRRALLGATPLALALAPLESAPRTGIVVRYIGPDRAHLAALERIPVDRDGLISAMVEPLDRWSRAAALPRAEGAVERAGARADWARVTGMRVHWHVPLIASGFLATDAERRRTSVVLDTPEGTRVERLGSAAPPSLPTQAQPGPLRLGSWLEMPPVPPVRMDAKRPLSASEIAELQAILQELHAATSAERGPLVQRLVERAGSLFDFARAVVQACVTDGLLDAAETIARRELALAEPVAVEWLHRALAIIALGRGDREAALLEWRAILERSGEHALHHAELLEAVAAYTEAQPAPSSTTRYLDVLDEVDRAIAEGQPRAALRRLSRGFVLPFGDRQAVARRVAIWLALEPETSEDRFERALVLASAPDALAADGDAGLVTRRDHVDLRRATELVALARAALDAETQVL